MNILYLNELILFILIPNKIISIIRNIILLNVFYRSIYFTLKTAIIRENLSIITIFPNEARPFYNNTTQTAFFGLPLINLFTGILLYIFDALYFAFLDPIAKLIYKFIKTHYNNKY